MSAAGHKRNELCQATLLGLNHHFLIIRVPCVSSAHFSFPYTMKRTDRKSTKIQKTNQRAQIPAAKKKVLSTGITPHAEDSLRNEQLIREVAQWFSCDVSCISSSTGLKIWSLRDCCANLRPRGLWKMDGRNLYHKPRRNPLRDNSWWAFLTHDCSQTQEPQSKRRKKFSLATSKVPQTHSAPAVASRQL